MNFGIVGYGRFGKLWAKALVPFGAVCVNEKIFNPQTAEDNIEIVDLAQVAQADVVFLLVPISEFAACCQQIKPYLKPETLVVDCCSVKVYPANIMQKTFAPTQPIIATHPLFGPDSVQKSGGLQDHKIVVCPIRCSDQQQTDLQNLFKKMGLQVLLTTPDEHDKQMANSQALVHFIGRGLAALDLQPQELATPDFQALLNINKMVVNDTWRLFLDMHQYNSYAKPIRKKFIHQLLQVEKAIEHAKT
jgi:prephenate dehydrogenase